MDEIEKKRKTFTYHSRVPNWNMNEEKEGFRDKMDKLIRCNNSVRSPKLLNKLNNISHQVLSLVVYVDRIKQHYIIHLN